MKKYHNRRAKTTMPTAGRIGRLARHIEKKAGGPVALKIMKDAGSLLKASAAGKADWLMNAIEKLKKEVGARRTRDILEACGRMCCGVTTRKRVRQIASTSKSTTELLENMNKARVGGGRLKLVDSHTITGGYDHCYCGQVKYTKEPFPDTTYCNCSVGWYKQLFETALEKKVEVKILQSIISGAKSCEFVIHI